MHRHKLSLNIDDNININNNIDHRLKSSRRRHRSNLFMGDEG